MTKQEAKQYVADHDETDVKNSGDLEQVFTALAGRAPDEEESKSLWWHISELMQD